MPAELLSHTPVLNSYNVAQLQYALENKGHSHPISFIHDLSPSASPAIIADSDLDYESRRMSSSATSATDTDSSGLSRGEKRTLTPVDSPQPQKARGDQNSWDNDSSHSSAQDKSQADAGIDSKVQLPSIFTSFEGDYPRRASLPTLHSDSRRYQPYPSPTLRGTNYNQSHLHNYTFPASANDDPEKHRPRLSTDLNNFSIHHNSDFSPYPQSGISNGTTPTSFSSSNFSSPMHSEYHRSGLPPYNENDNWNVSTTINRPSSTPGQLSPSVAKYDDSMRHASFSAPMSQAQMFAGSARISGQHDRRSLSGIKGDWSFPNNDFVVPSSNAGYSASMPPAPPSINVAASPSRSPQTVPSSTLADRPQQRKRGKLPKETTDFLKAWLHRHSDHPYPSEEEKKQLCHATGLSMSQVSNWMINARRRILAPAHRAASGPTTTAPFPPVGRSSSLSGLLDPAGRRSSMPNAESLQLYPPLTLQSIPNNGAAHHHHHGSPDFMTARHMMGQTRSAHLGHMGGGVEYGSRSMGLYVPGQNGPHSAGPGSSSHYLSSSEVPLSAPASMSNHPFSSNSQTGQQNLYPSLNPSPRLPHSSQAPGQYFDGQAGAPGSTPGSGYATPQ